MGRGIGTVARAGLIGLAVLMAGCGWFRGDDEGDAPSQAPFAGPLLGGLPRAAAIYDIYSVDPDQGPLPGGQQVLLDGFFPAFAGAETIYTVYFGANAADYDTSFSPSFSTHNIHVLTPPGDAFGLVDVILRDTMAALDTAALYYGYEYIDPFAIIDVIPDAGPLPGGQQVEVVGRFPILSNISTVAEAYSAYRVYFGANFASFDPLFNPVITSGLMHVITPPGDMLGLVDVTVFDAINAVYNIYDSRTLTNGYEYLDPFAIIEVIPDAGPLPGGQQVEVVGRFPILSNISTVAEAYSAYRVFFGANPAGFDTAFDPVITPELMHVITPPGDMLGLVDVTVVDAVSDIMSVVDAIAGTYNFRRLPDGYEYVGDIELTSVDPDNGFILGDPVSPVFNFVNTPVTLSGTFPVSAAFSSTATAAEAYAAYGVYFGPRRPDRRAFFNSSVTPVITAERMYVRAPVGEDVGPVDVSVVLANAPSVFAELEKAYRYYSMYIGAIIPPSGPLSGGNPVDIRGLFVTEAIYTSVAADQLYSVFFDVNPALFDDITSSIVITAGSIDLAEKVYVSNSIHVVAPPGDALGFVDVVVMSDLGREPRAISDPLKYEYIDDLSIGDWLEASVEPNPVGKLPSGHLLVTLKVTGTSAAMEAARVFIVPQGGNPELERHRIDLVMESIGSDLDDNTTWTGTNANLIDTTIGSDSILTDGHAAIFIYESGPDAVVGYPDDEGSRIFEDAVQGRHFIIDTIPPRMLLSGPLLDGSRFFDPGGVNSDDFTTADIALSALHPFQPPQPPLMIATEPIPWDGSTIQDDNRAQIFYNVGSVANDFGFDDLRFNLWVAFEDVDVYSTLENYQVGAQDEDAFSGVRERQVAGFEFTPAAPPRGDRADGVLDEGDDVLVKWDVQLMATATPGIMGVDTSYTTEAPLSIWSDISPNLSAAPTILRASWTANPGIDWTDQNLLMPIVFRGVDRAGNYFPRGDAGNGIRKNWTLDRATVELVGGTDTFEQTAGPLNLWWLVNTGTEFRETNIPTSENTRNPNFKWQNSSHPDPEAVPEPERIFNFRLWRTDGTAPREEARDGLYRPLPLSGWNGWSAKDSLTTSEMQSEIEDSEGAWMLLVVIAADEAGNVEQWPLSDLGDISINPTITVASSANSSDNWRRWYVAPAEQVVETEVRPNFWHDKNNQPTIGEIDWGSENVFGNIEIVPLSARASESVAVTFRVDVIPDPSIAIGTGPEPIIIDFGLEGSFATPPTAQQIGPRSFAVTYVGLGDVVTRKPVHYVFRTTGRVTDMNGREIVDSTPANFKFVVVDSVAEYVEHRRSGDEQPIKELDRP